MAVHNCNFSTWKVKAGGSNSRGQPGLQSETLWKEGKRKKGREAAGKGEEKEGRKKKGRRKEDRINNRRLIFTN
jgi:hypothetical protein